MNKFPDFMECFASLIALPSISSTDPNLDQSNKSSIDLLASWFTDLGFNTEIIPVPGESEKYNMVACLGKGDGGLVLSGHTDTVPYDDQHWNQDPFKLTERDNRLYGLGAADMKCFFPMVIDVISNMQLMNVRQPVYILATADEECTMAGIRALMEANLKLGDQALIGEPTGLIPVYMHKGVMMETVRITGSAGHSSNPALGNSALEGMHRVISALMDWRSKLQKQYINNHFTVPVPTLNFGSIRGGDNPNRICAECELKVDLRILPDMQLDDVRYAMREVVTTAIDGSGLELDMHSIFHGIPAMKTDINSEIVKIAEKLSGNTAGTVTFGTEGPYLKSMGMNTVILGPGNIDQAHQANEYVTKDRIKPMMKIIKGMIGHFCLEERAHGH
jgi:acetylornithine deacetylase